jgi:hypothetical protein
MRTVAADGSQLIRSGAQQIIDGLRRAAVAGLDVDDLTEVLKVAFSEDNRIHAALTGAIGALDAAAEKAPEGELTYGPLDRPPVRGTCLKCACVRAAKDHPAAVRDQPLTAVRQIAR